MKHLIFMPSITTNRGECRLATKAGFSRFDRVFSFLYSDLYLPFRGYYGPESRLERVVIDSGKGKSLFVCPQMSITTMTHDIFPYRERTITRRPALPPRVREIQDRTIHRELIQRRRLLAPRLERPICSPTKILTNE